MKKMIFGLLLSVTAFSTNSLFAMDPPREEEKPVVFVAPRVPPAKEKGWECLPVPTAREIFKNPNTMMEVKDIYKSKLLKSDNDSYWVKHHNQLLIFRGSWMNPSPKGDSPFGGQDETGMFIQYKNGVKLYVDEQESRLENLEFCTGNSAACEALIKTSDNTYHLQQDSIYSLCISGRFKPQYLAHF